MRRREFLATAGGATAGVAAASAAGGTAAAQEQKPDFGGYIDGAQGGTYKDMRGNDEVTVTVGGGGGLAFLPTGLWIDTGTTVVFEWASPGHNVVPESIPDGASWEGYTSIEGEGFTYEFTFETGGIYKYFCQPHKGQGMLGAIAVGGDVPMAGGSSGGKRKELDPEHMGVPFRAHFVGIATILAIVVSLIFAFYVLKYGESAHSSSPNRK